MMSFSRKAALIAAIGAAAALCAGAGFASGQDVRATQPSAARGDAEFVTADQLTRLLNRMKKLEGENAEMAAEIAKLQASVAALESHAADYLPKSGPGGCSSRGYMSLASLKSNPQMLVHAWGSCKAN